MVVSGSNRVRKIRATIQEGNMMSRPFATRDKLLGLMSDAKPRSTREIAEQISITTRAAESVCYRSWKAGLLLRSDKALHERNGRFAGRAGTSYNTRSFYLYALGNGREETLVENTRFLTYSKTPRTPKTNKAQLVLSFLKTNDDKAFYTTQIVEKLKEKCHNS